MAVYQIHKDTEMYIQLYLFILQLLSLELCTQVKLAAAKYYKRSPQETANVFCF